jgi:O-antigen/teichoic acid export membrane protein
MVVNLGVLLAGFAGSVLAARILGPPGRGIMASAAIWVGLLATIADVGISQSVVYYAAKSRDGLGKVVGTAMAWAAIASVFMGCMGRFVLVPCLLARNHQLGMATASFLIYILPFLLGTYSASILQGGNRLGWFNIVRAMQGCAYFGGIALAWCLGLRSVQSLLLSIMACSLLPMLVGFCLVARFVPLSAWQVDLSLLRKMLRYGSQVLLTNISWLSNGRMDQMLLSLYVSSYQQGIYAVAVSYSTILPSISSAFAAVSLPRVAHAKSVDESHRVLRKSLLAALFCSVIVGAILASSASLLISGVFGAQYSNSTGLAVVLTVGGFALGLNRVLSSGLCGLGFPSKPLVGEVSGLAVTILGLLWALPRWGISGAALVSVASYWVTFSVLYILSWRCRQRTRFDFHLGRLN